MVKKITNIRMEDSTTKRLKLMAVRIGIPMGDLVKRLVDLADYIHAHANESNGFGELYFDHIFHDIDEKANLVPPYNEGMGAMVKFVERHRLEDQMKQNELDQEIKDLEKE